MEVLGGTQFIDLTIGYIDGWVCLSIGITIIISFTLRLLR
jgi:hypothetical protein